MRFCMIGIVFLVGSLSIAFTGCEPKPTTPPPKTSNAGGHDHEHPATFADALKLVDKHRATIKEAFVNKKPEDAHATLHEIGEVLGFTEKFAVAAATTDEAKKAAKAAVNDLFESFGAMDGNHGKEGKSYDEFAAKIDAA
ncbi:MAG: hypothetical protein ABL921_18585 [Pirellula sp.]